MITKDIIEKAKQLAYSDSIENGVPSIFQIDYAVEVAVRLSGLVGADINIVQAGTYLMDCALGTAYKQGKLADHANLSHSKARGFLNTLDNITELEKVNILDCVLEHHGATNFSSLESEVVCNADCYKFLSVKGVVGGIMHMRDMEVEQLIQIFKSKADEKWGALSLNVCKEELKDQYESVKKFLGCYTGK